MTEAKSTGASPEITLPKPIPAAKDRDVHELPRVVEVSAVEPIPALSRQVPEVTHNPGATHKQEFQAEEAADEVEAPIISSQAPSALEAPLLTREAVAEPVVEPTDTADVADTELLQSLYMELWQPEETTSAQSIETNEHDALAPAPVEAGVFDDEVMNAFQVLTELAALEQAEETPVLFVPYETLVEDQLIELRPETPKPTALPPALAELPVPEEAPDIATIRLAANEQPVAETLVQLAAYFSEAAEEPESAAIRQLLSEIAEELPGEGQEKPLITPELTQKLLTLLGEVGYQNPAEALVSFVEEYDLGSLLQTMRYLYQLTNDNDRQEFSQSLSTLIAPAGNMSSAAARLGKAIFRLIKANPLALEPQTRV